MSISSEQLKQLRDDTPACRNLLHFNNAGAALAPNPVIEAVLAHQQLEQTIGGYEAEAHAKDKLDHFYAAFAKLLNAEASEIAFVENATRGWDALFYALPLKAGDRVITHASEYASNYLAFLQIAQRRNIHIDLAPSDQHGQIDLDAIPGLVTPQTKLIAITHIPSQGGLVNPAAEIGKIAAKYGLLFLLDACQSVGQMPVDVQHIGCHMLSGTGRKFLRGPRGTGFLYVSHKIIDQLEPPFIDLHSAVWTSKDSYQWARGATRFENFESHVAGRIGLACAVDYALEIGLENIQKRVVNLAQTLRQQLNQIEGVEVQDLGQKKCGIVTFTCDKETPFELKARLNAAAANISVTLGNYAQLDLAERQLDALARASVHYYNTEQEIQRFCQLLEQQ